MAAASADLPTSVTGGCLCEAVRYTVTFPEGHDFDNAGTTCQCVQCRKQTGSLLARFHRVPSSAVTFDSSSTLSTYRASPEISRGFCAACGSFLFWRRDQGPNISFLVGSFDKYAMDRWGPALADANRHVWCNDEIAGVTDHLSGSGGRWRFDSVGDGAEQMPDKM